MTALEPGLYKATVRGIPDQTIFVDGSGTVDTVTSLLPVGEDRLCYHDLEDLTEVRQLIVLDVEEPAECVTLFRGIAFHRGPSLHVSLLNTMADQIEEQTKPARIPEPGQWGVVKATHSPAYAPTFYVNHGSGEWRRPSGFVRWDDLIDPTLVREGVPS